MNYYEILGVQAQATATEIKNAYRRLAKLYHPDRNRSREAVEQIQLINEAYATLGDPEKRTSYDLGFSIDVIFQPPPPSPEEIYRRDFKERKIREAWEAFVRKTWIQRKLHRIMRKLTYVFVGIAVLVIADFYLPSNETVEEITESSVNVATRNRRSDRYDFIRTDNFLMTLPFEARLPYDERIGRKVRIEYTPILRTVKTFGVVQPDDSNAAPMYEAQGTVYSPFLWPFLVCITGGIVLLRNKYTERNFHFSFVPLMPVFFMLLALWPKG